MAEIRAFRAYRYDLGRVGALSDVVAPPYDVIDPALQQALYDPLSGGCRDALHADRINQNEGAESTLSFLLALMDMRADEVRWNAMQLPVTESSPVLMAVSTGAAQ